MLVSDGGDNNSVHGVEEVTRMVRESRATIYAVGLFDANDRDFNPALLRRLAHISGGEAFFPEGLPAVLAFAGRSQLIFACGTQSATFRFDPANKAR